VTPPPRTNTSQRAVLERLWRRAEEIRSLCGLPPITPSGATAESEAGPGSFVFLVELLLADLERSFRRELATRVQLEGLGELMGTAVQSTEPGRSYRLLANYLARALNEPRLWLGILDGSPPAFTLFKAGDPAKEDVRPERVHVQWLHPDWLRWIALGQGDGELWSGPTGSRRGGPWYPMPIRGELPVDHFSGEMPICPGAHTSGRTCRLSAAPLEAMIGGHRACGSCEFRHVVALIGTEGTTSAQRRAALEAIASPLGAILVNLGLKEALDLEARFRDGVIEHLPLGVVAIDAKGRVVTWNRSAEVILGVDRATARGVPLRRITSDRVWYDGLIESLERGSEQRQAEQQLTRPDGATVPVEISTAPLRDSEGRIRGAVATLVDLSSLREMEERIRQLDRLASLGRFASSVAHELRNPLTGIATGVQYLSRGFPEGDDRHEGVRFILREVVRLNRIVEDLFSATRPRSLNLAPLQLAEVAERAVRVAASAAQEKQVEVRLESADTWPALNGDADQLQQVLLNLVQNAVEATPPGGAVVLRARAISGIDPARVEIEVEDTGAGIAPEHLPRVFDPFYTTRRTGTGLGLFVVHGIVQRHGGTIQAASEPGKGTTFRITLPQEPAWATENA
jgi:PAS domain S-box-containing protein